MTDSEIEIILDENLILKEENKRLRQLISQIQTSVREFELDFYEYQKAEADKRNYKAIKKIVAEDSDIVHKFTISIDDLPFSDRVRKVLKNYHCNTLGDIAKFQKGDFHEFKNIGMKGLTEINDILKSKGLSLGMDVQGIIRESQNR